MALFCCLFRTTTSFFPSSLSFFSVLRLCPSSLSFFSVHPLFPSSPYPLYVQPLSSLSVCSSGKSLQWPNSAQGLVLSSCVLFSFIACLLFTSIMSSTGSIPRSHALVVLSGDERSGGLAGDFAKIPKEFITNGFQPTLLSSLDLQAIMLRH